MISIRQDVSIFVSFRWLLYVSTLYDTKRYQDTNTNSNNSQCLVWHSIGWSTLHKTVWTSSKYFLCNVAEIYSKNKAWFILEKAHHQGQFHQMMTFWSFISQLENHLHSTPTVRSYLILYYVVASSDIQISKLDSQAFYRLIPFSVLTSNINVDWYVLLAIPICTVSVHMFWPFFVKF